MAKACKHCSSTEHTSFYCYKKPRKPIQTRVLPRKVGNQGKKTAQAVAKWKKTQKPNAEGYYVCYLCGKWVTYLMAEHMQSKARHPERRTDLTNLAPCCAECNEQKRSKNYEDIHGAEI